MELSNEKITDCRPIAVPNGIPIINTVGHSVNIIRAENGFMVHVGCKTFVSQSLAEIFSGIKLYFSKPNEAMKKYLSKS